MDVPSYHQILAEVYEENARNGLVHHNEYEDEEIGADDKYPDELEGQEVHTKLLPDPVKI